MVAARGSASHVTLEGRFLPLASNRPLLLPGAPAPSRCDFMLMLMSIGHGIIGIDEMYAAKFLVLIPMLYV